MSSGQMSVKRSQRINANLRMQARLHIVSIIGADFFLFEIHRLFNYLNLRDIFIGDFFSFVAIGQKSVIVII